MLQLFTLRAPFDQEISDYGIPQKVKNSGRPDRPVGYPTNPAFTEVLWNIVTSCWVDDAYLRPSARKVMIQLELHLPEGSTRIQPDTPSTVAEAQRGDFTSIMCIFSHSTDKSLYSSRSCTGSIETGGPHRRSQADWKVSC